MEYLGIEKQVNNSIPKVSVCIQTYQHGDFIEECLHNVLRQDTSFPIEIIIGEDESSDGTREICKTYAEKHPDRIRLFLRSREDVIYINGKPTGRFNMIENLKASRGKYIALCEGDDYWTDPLKLQKQVDFMEANPECSLISHSMPSFVKPLREGFYSLKQLFSVWYLPHTSNYLFRNFGFEKYKHALMNMPTGDMFILYACASQGSIYHSSELVSHYRINESGVYSSKKQIELYRFSVLQLKSVKKYFNVDNKLFHKQMVWRLERLQKEGDNVKAKLMYQKAYLACYNILSKSPFSLLHRTRRMFTSK